MRTTHGSDISWNRSPNTNVSAGILVAAISTIAKRTEGAGGTVY